MSAFLIRVLVNAFALAVIVTLLPQGIRIEGTDGQNELLTLLGIALIFGVVNAVIKPILTFLTCPFVVFTLGLFLIVINGAMFMLTAELSALLPGAGRLVVESFLWAIVGALLMSLIGIATEHLLGLNRRVKVKRVTEVRYRVREPEDEDVYFPPDDKPKR